LQSHIFNLVKYTKTLSVRNQRARYSQAFFRDKRASTRSPADSTPSSRHARIATHASSSTRPRHAEPTARARLESAPASIRLTLKPQLAETRNEAGRFKNRAPLHIAAHTVFKFVAIMRHAPTLGKRISGATIGTRRTQ